MASSIGAGITLAGVAFVAHQTRLMGFTNERIQMNQSSRFGIDRLRADLRMAGAGIGHDESGGYSGLEVGSFQCGGATFTSNNRALHNGKLTISACCWRPADKPPSPASTAAASLSSAPAAASRPAPSSSCAARTVSAPVRCRSTPSSAEAARATSAPAAATTCTGAPIQTTCSPRVQGALDASFFGWHRHRRPAPGDLVRR